jgi:hypothetical protein
MAPRIRRCTCAAAGKGLLDEVVDGLEQHDVRDEVEKDICGNATNAGADIECAGAAWGWGNERAECRVNCAQFWEEIEEKEAGTEGVDAGE